MLSNHLVYKKDHARLRRLAAELAAFGINNALSCVFPVFIFAALALSNIFHVPGIPRYDLILAACIGMQAFMYFTKMETRDELLVITLFHLLGLAMEIYKVHKGSWSYPEEAFTKIYGVPLYSGFMYASVASFVCQAWRRFNLRFVNWPHPVAAMVLGAGIYINFFTHHYFYDVRWYLTAIIFVLFYRTRVEFTNNGPVRKMPMTLAFFLIGLFIWIAENIATFLGAWKYAYQHKNWQMVTVGKLSSWGLLAIVSIIIVVQLKFVKDRLKAGGE